MHQQRDEIEASFVRKMGVGWWWFLADSLSPRYYASICQGSSLDGISTMLGTIIHSRPSLLEGTRNLNSDGDLLVEAGNVFFIRKPHESVAELVMR